MRVSLPPCGAGFQPAVSISSIPSGSEPRPKEAVNSFHKLILAAFLPLALCAQAVSPEAEQHIEKAHESLLKPKTKASKNADTLTQQTAPLRPAKVLSGPITRKNFIDEHI